MTVNDIYAFLNKIAPFKNQESYDNSGLLIGDASKEIKRVCLCLDVTVKVVDEAIQKSADLIISHHPIIFKPLSKIHSDSAVYKLVQSGISYIAAHTNFDMAEGGLSDVMLELLGLPKSCETPEVINPDGSGFGRISEINTAVSANELAVLCKKAFNLNTVRYVDGGKEIKRIAVCSGAGSDGLAIATEKNCDAYITGDVKHSAFVAAEDINMTLIDAGHFGTEITFCKTLYNILNTEFPNLEIFISENPVNIISV